MGNAMFSAFTPGSAADTIAIDKNNLLFLQMKKRKEEMTGWERVELIFTTDEYGDWSPELHRIKDATLIACVIGGIFGGIGRSRIAHSNFFRQNVETQFETPLRAKAALQDKIMLGMGSGAFRIGWRVSAFTFMYMTGVTLIAAYRGKHGIIDQVGGAGAAGFLYKFRDGPKAAVSGAFFGSLIGLGAGVLTVGTIKLFGMDMDSANMEYYTRLNKKLDKDRERAKLERSAAETSSLEALHEAFLVQLNQEKAQALEQSQSPQAQQSPSEKVEQRMKSIEGMNKS